MLGLISKAAGLITGAATTTASNLARFTGYTASALSALAAPAATASAAEIAALSAKQFASGAKAVASSVDNFAGAVMPAVGQAFDSSARMAQLAAEMSLEGINSGGQIASNVTGGVVANAGFVVDEAMKAAGYPGLDAPGGGGAVFGRDFGAGAGGPAGPINMPQPVAPPPR